MKKIIISVLMLSVLVLSACGGEKVQDSTQTYLGGSQGLKIKFAANAPPSRVSDVGGDEAFDVIVEINNKGENKVLLNDAIISIKGFPPEAFGKTVAELTGNPEEDVEGRIKTADGAIIEPPTVYATFENLKYQYREPGNLNYPVRAEICYLYETNVASKLCIKSDMTRQNPNDLCEVNGLRDISSSGAPVQVTKIQQSAAGKDKTRFTFTVVNRDTGRVFKEINGCQENTAYKDKVFVQVQNLIDRGAESVSCIGLSGGSSPYEGYLTLGENQQRDVTCTVTMTERSDRLQPFNIRLSYDYKEFIDTNLIVEYTPE